MSGQDLVVSGVAVQHHESVVPNIRNGVRFYYSDEPLDKYVPFHWHSSIELVCVLDGHLRFTIDGRILHVRGGQFAMVPSGSIHDVASGPNHAYVLQVPLRAIKSLYESPADAAFLNGQDHRPEYAEVLSCFEKMGLVVDHPSAAGWFDFEIYLLTILKHAFTTFCLPGANVRSADNVKEIISYLHEHATERFSVGELAGSFGYNPSYLSRMFKQQTGVSLVEYLYEVRVNRLHDELLSTSEPISALMRRNGLTNPRMARKVFLERYGMLPHEVRAGAAPVRA